MKYLLVVMMVFIVLSCNDQPGSGSGTEADSTKTLNSDTVPTGKSSSPSEFNKGNSSPTGSTGGVDSTAAAGAKTDKTDVDNRHPEINKLADSVKHKK